MSNINNFVINVDNTGARYINIQLDGSNQTIRTSFEQAKSEYGIVVEEYIFNKSDGEKRYINLTNLYNWNGATKNGTVEKDNVYVYNVTKNEGSSSNKSNNERIEINFPTEKNSVEVIIAYLPGYKSIFGETYIGGGFLSGSTKTNMWLESPKSQIEENDYFEYVVNSDYMITSDKISNHNVTLADLNNSDYVPFGIDNDTKIAIDNYSLGDTEN